MKFRYYRGDREALVKRIRAILSKEDVLLAIAFGSFVELESFRDLDIAVYSPRGNLEHYSRLTAKLELELGIPVDIVPLDEIPTRFRHKILVKGKLILESTPGLYEALLNQVYDELTLMRKT